MVVPARYASGFNYSFILLDFTDKLLAHKIALFL
jgi:hypothetical protein